MEVFLLTIMNTGTRSVKAYYEEMGHKVFYMHAMHDAWNFIGDFNYRVTTVRHPRSVALSWMKGPSPRFRNCNWREQWLLWDQFINTYDFEDYIVLEEFDGPVIGKDDRPIDRNEVWELDDKIQFALRILERNGFNQYGDQQHANIS